MASSAKTIELKASGIVISGSQVASGSPCHILKVDRQTRSKIIPIKSPVPILSVFNSFLSRSVALFFRSMLFIAFTCSLVLHAINAGVQKNHLCGFFGIYSSSSLERSSSLSFFLLAFHAYINPAVAITNSNSASYSNLLAFVIVVLRSRAKRSAMITSPHPVPIFFHSNSCRSRSVVLFFRSIFFGSIWIVAR